MKILHAGGQKPLLAEHLQVMPDGHLNSMQPPSSCPCLEEEFKRVSELKSSRNQHHCDFFLCPELNVSCLEQISSLHVPILEGFFEMVFKVRVLKHTGWPSESHLPSFLHHHPPFVPGRKSWETISSSQRPYEPWHCLQMKKWNVWFLRV